MLNSRKKILLVGNLPVTFKVFFEDLIYSLKKNIDVEILTNKKYLKKNNQIKNIKYFHLPFERKIKIFIDLYCLIKMTLFLRKNKYDLVISITPKSGLISSIASFLTSTRKKVHIFTGQVWFNKNFFYKNFLILFDKMICVFSKYLICDSKSQRNFLYEKKLTKKKIKVIGSGSICGVDTIKFSKLRNKIKIRRDLNFNKDDLILIFVGRINSDKGIHLLLDSFQNIYYKYDNLKLLLVGEDEINIKNLLKKNYKKITNRIKIVPFTNNVNKFLKISDIFVFPSYREGFGLSVIEALSTGLPVIVSDTYGLKDSFLNKINGLKFKTGSQKSLEKSIINLIKNKKMRLKFSKNSRPFVLKKFEKKRVINLYRNYFMRLI